MVITLVIHVITWITTNLLTPEGWNAEMWYPGLHTNNQLQLRTLDKWKAEFG